MDRRRRDDYEDERDREADREAWKRQRLWTHVGIVVIAVGALLCFTVIPWLLLAWVGR